MPVAVPPLPERPPKPSQVTGWGGTQLIVKSPVLTENNLKHALAGSPSQVLPLQTPPSVTARKARPRGAGETRNQEDGDQLTNLCRLAGSQAGAGEDLMETHL